MWPQIKNNIKADSLILLKSSLVRGAFWIVAIIVVFVLYTSSGIVSELSQKGYYTSQMLITLAQFNVFIIIIIGAILGARDFDWLTYSLRLVNTKRLLLSFSRIIVIFLFSALLLMLHIIIGFFFDVLGGTIEALSLDVLFKFATVIIVIFLWGCLSYLIAFSSKNFTVASSIGVGYFLLESFVGRFFPQRLLQLLPVWNQKSLLKHFFEVNEGAVAIIQQGFGNYVASLIVIFIYIVAAITLLFFLAKRKQY